MTEICKCTGCTADCLYLKAEQEQRIRYLEAKIERMSAKHNAIIEYTLEKADINFLRAWAEGDFDALRNKWPDAPTGLYTLANSEEFYRKRCEELQKNQNRMRDPERQMVCDILANGKPRDAAGIGEYIFPDEE